jgi:hypothetical protein
MTTRIRLRRLGPIATLGMVLAACSPGSVISSVPSRTSESSAAASTPFATTASASAAVALIPDGTYVTASISDGVIVAKIKADTTLTAAQRATDLQAFTAHTSETFKITFQSGAFTQFEAWDGGSFEVGSRATYVFPDDHTLLIQETCCGLTTFDVTRDGSSFSLHVRSQAMPDPLTRIVFESAPFTAVP